jgi:endo-1,4-beta-xylanase
MVTGRFALPVSQIALTTSLALSACSSEVEDTSTLGTSAQALAQGADRHESRGLARQHERRERERQHGPAHPHHPGHHHEQDCDDDNEPPAPPDPVVFTPATAAARSGRDAGVAVSSGPLAAEPLYASTIAAEFSDVVPENETKWGPLQPVDARHWSFAAADAIVAFARDNDLRVKGHTLIWHSQLPPFITPDTSARRLAEYAERHIETTVERYRRDLFAWDVVNEAIADDGSGLRASVFSDAFGERFIERAFRLARAADRDAELYYNDYGIENQNPKSDAVYALLERLRERGVPVDGVGFQAHLDARFAPSLDELVQNFERFAALGLSVNISELDVRIAGLGGSAAYKRAVQKQIYQRVSAACVLADACAGVTTWGFTDKYSWIDSTFGADDPLLFDEAYQRKPAYYGYVDGFLGVPLDDPSLEPNLIGNSSLEAGLEGWSVLGAGALATEVALAHTGLRSAKVSGRLESWQGPRHDVTALTGAGRTYDVSVFARIAGATSATTGLTAQVTCAGQATQFQPIAGAIATDTGWVELAGALTLPDCDLQTVAVYVEGPAPGVDVLVDDLALREQPLPNLIANPDFEAGTAGWFAFGPATLATTSDAHAGTSAAIATNRSADWNGVATNLTSLVAPTATYRAGAWMKIRGAGSSPIRLTAALRCAGQATQFVPVAAATGSDSAWTELGGSLQIPDCSLEDLTLYAEGPAAGIDILLDDVSVFQLSAGLGPSVLANGGFESGTGGWFGFGSVAVEASSARAHSGAQSAHVSGRTDTWNGLATSLLGLVTPGRSYRASGFAQVGAASAPVNLTLQSACDGRAPTFTPVAFATASDSSWAELGGTLVVPDCNLTTAFFYIEGAPAGVDIYLDDVSLRPLP